MFSSNRKSYYFAPKWPLSPSSIPLGSVITSLIDEHLMLENNKDLSTYIDTEISINQTQNCSDKKIFRREDFRVFSMLKLLFTKTHGAYASFKYTEYDYACELMETRSFKPSPKFIAKVAADPVFKSHLESGFNVFVVTGVKIANRGSITITTETDIVTTMGTIPLGGVVQTPIDQPTLFAFQVEKVGFTWMGKPTSKPYVKYADIEAKDKTTENMTQGADKGPGDEDGANSGMETRDGLGEDGETRQSSLLM
ncbi:hypothetical protein THARTR1_08275 [Trichoderma harzianum]|uniref:Uncharacterized protein n=1 Tax=Trichoderma harzianum TaxID=5544 RepID=A0A2K0TZV4_TRIHA|nr:hypothetical protein THARTR1_08275 [Trichoderma harzianum]